MTEFPRTMIEDVSVSRMVIGTNWFMGFSHTSHAKSTFIKDYMDAGKVADILEVFLNAGVDTMLGQMIQPVMLDGIKMAEDRTGRGIIKVGTPILDISDSPDAEANTDRLLDEQMDNGVTFCLPHQCNIDALTDRRKRCIQEIDGITSGIRKRGMIPGLSTHIPESVVFSDERDHDIATYIQIYNAAGFLMPIEVDWIHRLIQRSKHPVLTIKPLAAGRLLPLVGLAFVWSTIRDQDMVAIGTMTPDEAAEVIEISMSLLERRSSEVALQETRSKQVFVSA